MGKTFPKEVMDLWNIYEGTYPPEIMQFFEKHANEAMKQLVHEKLGKN